MELKRPKEMGEPYNTTLLDRIRRPAKYLVYLGAAGLIAYSAPRFYEIWKGYPALLEKVKEVESKILEVENSITDLSPIVMDLKDKSYANSNRKSKQAQKQKAEPAKKAKPTTAKTNKK